MNLFQLKEYWRYHRSAMGRHGVHSPAVYRFVEDALKPAAGRFKPLREYRSENDELWQGDDLLRRIVQHFHFREIVVPAADGGGIEIFHAPSESAEPAADDYDRLFLWKAFAPQVWARGFDGSEPYWSSKDIIAITGIHESPAHLAAWKELCGHPEPRLSIDLFRIGLLFFSPDFKEPQHFVLKYPA